LGLEGGDGAFALSSGAGRGALGWELREGDARLVVVGIGSHVGGIRVTLLEGLETTA